VKTKFAYRGLSMTCLRIELFTNWTAHALILTGTIVIMGDVFLNFWR